MFTKKSEKVRQCPNCHTALVYTGQSAVREGVELWQCTGACSPKTYHLNADGTQATPPPFPGKK